MSEKLSSFESQSEKILSREEVLLKLVEYANTSEYEIVGEGKDPKGLTLLDDRKLRIQIAMGTYF
jgi:hypothetical protein